MDKHNSFRCVKFALIAGNTAVIALGLTGFVAGLLSHDTLQRTYNISGSQLALVSSVAVLVAFAGLIGALREHFFLLLGYAFCIVATFIFRLAWLLTAHLHQSDRFVMDITVSLTLLSSLAKLFLLIFAILEALTIQNSLPLTKKKFLFFKNKLKKSKDPTLKSKKKKKPMMSKPPQPQHLHRPRPKNLNYHQTENGIYVTASSIYGSSGRRRSPGSKTNGHYGTANSRDSSSSRAKKYLPGVGYSASSPNASDSSSSQDSNNNKKVSKKDFEKKRPTSPVQLVIDKTEVEEVSIPMPRKSQNKSQKNYHLSDNYYHFQSPSPSTPEDPKQSNQQQFFPSYSTPNRSSMKSPKISTTSSLAPISEVVSSTTNSNVSSTRSSVKDTSGLPARPPSRSPAAAVHYSSQITKTSSLPSTRSTSSRAISTTTNPNAIHSSSYSAYSSWTTSSSTVISPTSNTASISRLLASSSPSVVSTTVPLSSSSSWQNRTPNSQASIFTTPSSSSYSYRSTNLFDTPKPYGSYQSGLLNSITLPNTGSTVTTTTTTTATTKSNLNQTRSLFSTYTSPYSKSATLPSSQPLSSSQTKPLFQQQQSSYSTTAKLPYTVKSPSPSPNPTPTMSPELLSPRSTKWTTSPLRSSYSKIDQPSSKLQYSSSASNLFETPTTRYSSYSPQQSTALATTTPSSTSNTTSSSFFSRSYPKTYQEYVKSYQYPSTTATTTTIQYSTIIPSLMTTAGTSSMIYTTTTSHPSGQTFFATGFRQSDRPPTTQQGNKQEYQTTRTITTKLTTTQQHEVNEQQKKEAYFYEQIIHES